MALVFSRRNSVYIFCILAVFLATILYTVGFLAPYWQRNNVSNFWQGIWFTCFDSGNCLRFDAGTDWMKAVRILQIIGMVGLVAGCALVFFFNCRVKDAGHTRTVEVVILFAALIGFSGAMVYVGHWKDDIEDSDGLLNFAWAFAMNVGACALAIIAAIILFFANKNLVETKDSELEAPLPMEWTSTWEAQPGPAGPAVISHNALRPKYPGWEMGIPDPMLRNHYVPDPTTAGYVHRPRPSGRGSGKKYAEYPPEPYPSYPYPYATRGFAPVPVPSHHTRRPAYEQEGDVLYSNVAPYYEEEVMAVAAAPRPAPVVRMSPVVLPRLVIRGQYEPGYGYQEYRFQ